MDQGGSGARGTCMFSLFLPLNLLLVLPIGQTPWEVTRARESGWCNTSGSAPLGRRAMQRVDHSGSVEKQRITSRLLKWAAQKSTQYGGSPVHEDRAVTSFVLAETPHSVNAAEAAFLYPASSITAISELVTSSLKDILMFVAPKSFPSLSWIGSVGFLKPRARSYFYPCYST